jgi:hypothetical protein
MPAVLAMLSLGGCKTSTTNPTSSGQARLDQGKHNLEVNTTVIDFSKYKIGKLPEGFTTAVTNGEPGKWVIADANGKKVLAQTDTNETDSRFPLCIYDKIIIKDVKATADFMAVSGKLDQAAGLVARYKDENNYYITRANALEDNVRLYKVESGKRIQIAGANLKVTAGQWHNLKLEVCGTNQKVFYDGKLVIDANDATFTNAGKVGFWTKADSVTYFADLKIE